MQTKTTLNFRSNGSMKYDFKTKYFGRNKLKTNLSLNGI